MYRMEEFSPKHAFVICVDSDGCAMDTMNIKHFRCFGPCMVTEWGLEAWQEPILARWNEINLFSGTRGINRFKGLAIALTEINAQYTPIDGVEALAAWADEAPELSNAAAESMIPQHAVFAKALAWSKAVNEGIRQLPQEEVRPFEGVQEALAFAHQSADVVIVSSANAQAVKEEWTRFGLLPHVDLACTQEMGSKAECIRRVLEKGYAPDHVLMCGDAPGDDAAAAKNGVLYYPILVNHEKESWERFVNEAFGKLLDGSYAGAYQEALRTEYRGNLGID